MSPAAPRTVVVHHRSGIGDLIWHIPYFRAVAAGSEGGKVSVIARPSCRAADILSAEPTIEEVIEYDRRPRPSESRRGQHDALLAQLGFVADLRRRKFERAVIFSGRMRYGILAMLAGISQRAGFGFSAGQRLFLNQPPFIEPHEGPGSWVYPEATAFAIAQGFVRTPLVPRLHVPAELAAEMATSLAPIPRPRFALAIGASEASKRWPNAHFAELTRRLTAAGAGVVLLGGPAESAAAQAIVDGLPAEQRERVLCQTRNSVLRSAAVLRDCDFCIGNDTGILNVSAAVECPCLGLFGATRPLLHDPLLHALEGSSMAAIGVGDVLDRLVEVGAPALPSPAHTIAAQAGHGGLAAPAMLSPAPITPQRMKILQVLHNHKTGGAEHHLISLCEGLRGRGHQIEFAGAARSWVGKALAERDFTVHDFDFRGHFDLPAMLRLPGLVGRERFDLVHAHLVRAARYARLATRMSGTPLVCTVHDLLTWRHYPRARPLIAVSEAVRKHLVSRGFSAGAIDVIYPGARDCELGEQGPQTRAATREALGLDEQTLAIGLIGRVAQVKGHDVALAAMPKLKALADHPLRLFFIGPLTSWGRQLQKHCNEPGVSWLGPRDDIPALLAALDICIQPSRSEGMPLTLMEAASAAKPVVASSVGGVPEIIRDGESGLLIPPESPGALAAALAELANDPERAAALGQRLHQRFAREFSLPVMVAQTEQRYLQLLEANG